MILNASRPNIHRLFGIQIKELNKDNGGTFSKNQTMGHFHSIATKKVLEKQNNTDNKDKKPKKNADFIMKNH